ncbi:MAG: LysM peptidoglycan-binding domain-containing protein [Verrucomicrobiales bacterium]
MVKGDTLFSLSRRYGTSVSAIKQQNGLVSDTIKIGQVLALP